MTGQSKYRTPIALVGLLLASAVMPSHAGRGLLLNAVSAEALGMAGADIAVARDTAALNINPAGLTQITGSAFDSYIEPFDAYGFKHTDSLGNSGVIDNPFGAILAASYAKRLADHPDFTVGIGLFAQGGTSLGYESLLTSYGTRDALSANIGVFRFVTGFGYRVSDQLSVGAAVAASYARGNQKFFPGTSDAATEFYGLRFDSGSSVTPNAQAGIQYHPTPAWTIATAYTSKTKLPLKGATATLNFESLGLGRVRYDKARLDGIALPQELDVGIAWRPDARWLLSVEYNWLDYSDALSATRLRASNPDNASAPASLDATSPQNWRDQHVFAAGAAYQLDQRTILRAGFSVQNSPVPGETLSPPFNLGQKREVTAGFSRKLGSTWSLDTAVEYLLPVSYSYNNPSLPLGTNLKERYALVGVLLAVSRRW